MKRSLFIFLAAIIVACGCNPLYPDVTKKGNYWVCFPKECETVTVDPIQNGMLVVVDGHRCSPDSAIEKQIFDYWNLESTGEGWKKGLIWYHKEVCTGFSITASEKWFGRESGEDLSGFFSISKPGDELYGKWYLLFSAEKRLLCDMPDHMPLKDYVALKPIMLPMLYLEINDTGKEDFKGELTVTVTITFDGGKVLSGLAKLNR